nr:hypothetical protein [Methylobacterium sp. ZNC0032]
MPRKHTPDRREASAFSTALLIWSMGQRLPMWLAAKLMAEGYDVAGLEERHRS